MTSSRELDIDFNPEARRFFREASADTRFDAAPVLSFLSIGFQVTWFEERHHRVWLGLLKPKSTIAQQFALNLEYVIIGHGFEEDFQQRTLLEEPPEELRFRIDSRIRFVASSAPLMKAACAAWAAENRIAIVPIDSSQIDPESDQLTEQLFDLLSASLWRRDIFDDSEPVTESSEFFGREQSVQEIVSRIFLGRPVAVFGLRKIGKTSLLRRVQGLLEADRSRVIGTAFIQCNATKYRAGRWWDVVADIAEGWTESLQRRADAVGSKVSPGARKLRNEFEADSVDPAGIAAAFEKDVEKLRRAARQIARDAGANSVRLVAILDEADELYPTNPSAGYWRRDYFELWNTLQTTKRGLDAPEDLVYVLGGVNPVGVEAGALLDRPNPLFELGTRYLGPLDEPESLDLLQGLGSRIGLQFTEASCRRAHDKTGGHPWLLRKLGSKIHLASPDRSSQETVTTRDVDRIYSRTQKAFYAHVDWILKHLRTVAPDEYELLKDIAVGGEDKYMGEWGDRQFRDTFADHLAQFGLVSFVDDVPMISIPLVREALTVPASSDFEEQKRRLKETIDDLEQSWRYRLARDIERGRSLPEAIEAIVASIPSESTQRAFGRKELTELGLAAGIDALTEGLNWNDYILLSEKYHEDISWYGEPMSKNDRIAFLRDTVEFIHIIRHNNDALLRDSLRSDGFDGLIDRLRRMQEMISS